MYLTVNVRNPFENELGFDLKLKFIQERYNLCKPINGHAIVEVLQAFEPTLNTVTVSISGSLNVFLR